MRLGLLLCAVLASTSAFAGSDSLESIANAFIATYAKDNVAWKKDIQLTSTPREVPAGRQIGLSTYVGYYTFVPKLWAELTPSERQDVLNDPRLRAFIVSNARPASYPSEGAADAPATKEPGFDPAKPSFPITGTGGVAQAATKPQP